MKLSWAYHCNAPTHGVAALRAEHERVTDLWDELVDIEDRWRRECEDAACAWDPTIATARKQIADLSSAIHAMEKSERKPLYQARHEQRVILWDGMKRWRKERKDEAAAIEGRRQAAVKSARRRTPAWWPNYNETIQRYLAGRLGAMKAGRRLRHHDDDRDDGVLAVQIQRTRSGLGAAPDELSLSMITVEMPGARAWDRGTPKARRWATVTMRVDTEGNTVTLPMYMHRRFPVCRIKGALLTWRRQGNDIRWQMVFRLAGVEPENRIRYRREGTVTFGWANGDGLTIAYPSWREPYKLPPDWMAGMDRIANNQAWLDRSLDEARASVSEDPVTRSLLARGPRSIYALRREQLPESLHGWLTEWRRVWWRNDHGRRKLLRRRKDLYRQWAREIVRECSVLTIDDQRLDKVARAERNTAANRDRHRACVHFLRAEIIHQANKIGAEVFASGKLLTLTGDEQSGAWQRRKAAKRKRSQDDDNDQPSQ